MKVECGGHPKPTVVRGKKHFIHFTELPHGIMNMESGQLPSRPRLKNGDSDTEALVENMASDVASKFSRGYDPVLPVVGKYLFFAHLGTCPYVVTNLHRSLGFCYA